MKRIPLLHESVHPDQALSVADSTEMTQPRLTPAGKLTVSRAQEVASGDAELPLVSVIIPTYNRPDMLVTAVQSALDQTYPHLEVIVVNDGGIDVGSQLQAIDSDGKITYVRLPRNGGRSRARNAGLALARGKYVAYLDDDDRYYPHHIQTLVECLESSDCKVAYTDAYRAHQVKTERGYETVKRDLPYSNDFNLQRLLVHNLFPTLCVMHERACLDEVGGFDESLATHEDWDLWIRLAEKFPVCHLSVVTAEFSFRTDGSSTTSSMQPDFIRTLKRVHQKHAHLAEGLPHVKAAQMKFYEAQKGYLEASLSDVASGVHGGFSVVIVTYNSAATIESCLQSVLRTLGEDDEVIVVDNASVDHTVSIVETLARHDKRLTLVPSPKNLGFSEGSNLGIRRSSGEYVILLNPDTYVTPGWLDRMRAHFAAGKVGAVGPTSDYVAGLQKVSLYLPADRISGRTPEQVAEALAAKGHGGVDTKLLIGFCMMLSRQVLEDVGLLDPELFLGNDDLDMSWRLRQKGYSLRVATDVFVHHVGQVSFNTEPSEKTRRLVQESTDVLARKLVKHYGPGKVPSAMELWGITWFTPSVGILDGGPLTSIVVLTYNQLPVTRLCVESVFRHTRDFELVVVDNGSSDGTVEYLRTLEAQHANVKILLNPSNRGFAGGCNQGIAVARGRDVVLLNNDTVVSEGWLEGMLSAAEASGAGLVGPRTNRINGPQQVDDVPYDERTLAGFEEFAQAWRKQHRAEVAEIHRLMGFCLLIRREVIERIGGLDSGFGKGNLEDDDYCLRAALAGFRVIVANEVFIHHFGSVTFKGQRIDYRDLIAENWKRFKAKWRLRPELPLEKGYQFADALQVAFDPDVHCEPVYSPRAAALPLPDSRGFNFALVDAEPERLKGWVQSYLEAFAESDDVALHILAGSAVGVVAQLVETAISELGRDPAHIPDLSIVDVPGNPLDLPRYLASVDVVLGQPSVAQGARDMGLPAFTEPNPAHLRMAAAQFRAMTWKLAPITPPALAKERWLLDFQEHWEEGLREYLESAPSDGGAALVFCVPPGKAEEAYETLSEWLAEHGYEAESIPDVTVAEWPTEALLALMRTATVWVDQGNALKTAMAEAAGLQIRRPMGRSRSAQAES